MGRARIGDTEGVRRSEKEVVSGGQDECAGDRWGMKTIERTLVDVKVLRLEVMSVITVRFNVRREKMLVGFVTCEVAVIPFLCWIENDVKCKEIGSRVRKVRRQVQGRCRKL